MNSMQVAKANDLIRNSKNTFTLQQQKMVLHVVSKIKPNDTVLKYEFNIKEFCELLNMEANGKNYKDIKKNLRAIRNAGFWLDLEIEEVTTAFFDKVRIAKQSGMIGIEIDRDLYPFLLELKENGNFTTYHFINIKGLKSSYSVELYEFFKSYEYSHKTIQNKLTISVERIKSKLGVSQNKGYERFVDFRRKLLDKAIKEINKETDINVEYETKRSGRPITHLIFKVTSKIGDEYFDIPYVSETLDRHNPNQLTMEELLRRGHQAEEE